MVSIIFFSLVIVVAVAVVAVFVAFVVVIALISSRQKIHDQLFCVLYTLSILGWIQIRVQ
jgi:uncharacterized membrane protein